MESGRRLRCNESTSCLTLLSASPHLSYTLFVLMPRQLCDTGP